MPKKIVLPTIDIHIRNALRHLLPPINRMIRNATEIFPVAKDIIAKGWVVQLSLMVFAGSISRYCRCLQPPRELPSLLHNDLKPSDSQGPKLLYFYNDSEPLPTFGLLNSNFETELITFLSRFSPLGTSLQFGNKRQ